MTNKPIIRIYPRDADQLLHEDMVNTMTPQLINLADALFCMERYGRHDYGDEAAPIYLRLAVHLFDNDESRHAIVRMLLEIDESAPS